MDLRSGNPFWVIKNGLLATYPALKHHENCDVAIIGGGITGALVAHQLVQENVETVMLDKRDIGMGSTAASTALLQYATDTELVDLIPLVGEAQAVRSYRVGLEAIDKLEGLVRRLEDDCGFARKKSLYLASKKSHLARLRQEHALRVRHGFQVEYLEAKDIERQFPFTAPGAIFTTGDAQVDAFRLTHLLLRDALGRGLRVYDRCEVTRIENAQDHVVLTTQRGSTLQARRVVFATGYESQPYLKQRVGTLHSTFALITEPLEAFPRWPDQCLIWETDRPYFYVRATDDGRLLAGGEDTPFATAHHQEGLIKRKARKLERRLTRMFPGTEIEVAYTWAGTFGTTDDGLAYIGQTPEWPNAYFALGYGGNGITLSVVAAELIADHYLGRHHPDADLFRFDR